MRRVRVLSDEPGAEGGVVRALTLWQPWASFMVAMPKPPKRNETRGWATRYRGPLLIHAAKREPRWVRDEFARSPLCHLLSCLEPWDDLPRGAVVGRVELVDCLPVEGFHVSFWETVEAMLGDYSPGRSAWVTEDPVRFERPITARGRQGLWIPDETLLREVARA